MCKHDIATKLTLLRKQKGVTQEEAANALAVSGKTVSKWETGISTPDIDTLVSLSRYYDVTVDCLLGLDDGEKDTANTIKNEFSGLGRAEAVLKAFEIITAIFPALFHISLDEPDHAVPTIPDTPIRNAIVLPDIFDFAVASDDVNLSVIQFRNRSNFSWLQDEKKTERISRLLSFLAAPDVMKLLAFIHSADCSPNFTADYISENTGLSLKRVSELLDTGCKLELCSKVTAHLRCGEETVYESYGDGLMLAIISIAYERMCGKKKYDYHNFVSCKMIGD